MLTEHVKEWTVQWKEQGRQEGLQEGRADVLLGQLESKIGTLDDSQRQLILDADRDKLLSWANRLLTAQTWEQVVEDP